MTVPAGVFLAKQLAVAEALPREHVGQGPPRAERQREVRGQ